MGLFFCFFCVLASLCANRYNDLNMLKQTSRQSERGVALLITLIISAIMLVSVTAFSREMVDEIRNATRIDNSMIAYYAAEAGLEDALLEWRDAVSSNSPTEISDENDKDTSADSTNVIGPEVPAAQFTGNRNNTPRCVNLDNSQRIPATTCSNNRNSNTRYYGVRMWYKQPVIANQVVKKDEVYELEVPNMTSDVTLDWSSLNTPANTGMRVEIIGYNSDGSIIPPPLGRFFTRTVDSKKILLQNQVGSGKKIFRIKPWNVVKSTNEDQGAPNVTPGLPVPSINLNISSSSTSNLLGSPVTNIESVGYYGGVARKITATLDRTSGNIISIFDNVIYSESALTK